MKNYDGMIKRLLFDFSEEKGGFEPFFYLLYVRRKNIYQVDEAKRELLKEASGNGKHKLVTFHGIFHDRQMSVER